MGIGELSPAKFKCETLEISKDFIKFSECQVPLRKFKPRIQDFLATVLVFKLHFFSCNSSVAFDSYQSEKVRNTRIVNLTISDIKEPHLWVRFVSRVLLVCVRFLQPW